MPTELPLYTVLPFVAMLLAIALFPLWLPHWWESNRSKLAVAAVLGGKNYFSRRQNVGRLRAADVFGDYLRRSSLFGKPIRYHNGRIYPT